MSGFAKGLVGALAVALTMFAAGCSGSPCDTAKCSANETCNADTGKCEGQGLCKDVQCPAGSKTGCDPATGQCKNLCKLANAPKCTAPQACNPATGACEDLCAGVTCANNTLKCDQATGECKPKCGPTTCTAEQTCEPTTGTCTKKCETDKKPTGKPECGEGLKCQKTTGECVTLCTDVACPYAQWCDDATGLCKGGQPPAGRPGAACESDDQCQMTNGADGQEFTCSTDALLGPAPQGYCSASCSQTMACPQGSYCLGNACYDQCTKDADCRGGYRCQPLTFLGGSQVPPNQYLCLPSTQCTKADQADCAPVGGNCKTEADCVSGAYCIPEEGSDGTYTGWDDGYCLWPMRKTDQCPQGSTALPGSNSEPNYQICLKSCTLEATAGGLAYGTPSSCGLGETCAQLSQNSLAGICYQESCDVDNDCQLATCTQSDKSNCGNGQACNNGSCRVADKCTKDSECSQGTKCDTVKGECFNLFCDAAIGACQPDCTVVDGQGDKDGACAGKTCAAGTVCSNAEGGKCVSTICPSGTTCNATTKKCDRACTRDANCGTNGVCENNVCIAFCTKHNESKLCGTDKVCGDNGHCQAKCTDDASCGDGAFCEASSGHCIRKCNAATNPLTCGDTQLCDESTGKCTDKCTSANELQICGQSKYCQTSTGKCLADCSTNEAICGTEKCSVDPSAHIGVCGQECVTNANCGQTPGGTQLTCQAVAGSTVKRCQ